MKLKDMEIDLLDAGKFALDGGAMFGVIPKVFWSKAYYPGDEINRIPLAARPLLIKRNDRKILVDCGNGTKLPDKLAKIYKVDKNDAVENALKKFGLNPEDITDVILTHLHFDHAGGATTFDSNGEIVPTFPNAKYYVQKDHFAWAINPSEKDAASFMKPNYEPLKALGVLEELDGGGELFPGIRLEVLHGHTRAMQAIEIDSGGEKFFYAADLTPTSAHIPFPWIIAYDNEPLTTLEEKKRIIPKAYEENTTFIFEHDARVQAAKIRSTEKGFEAGEKVVITPPSGEDDS